MRSREGPFGEYGVFGELAKRPLSAEEKKIWGKVFVWRGEVKESWEGKGEEVIASEMGIPVSTVTDALQHVVLHVLYEVAKAPIKVSLPGPTFRSELRNMLRSKYG